MNPAPVVSVIMSAFNNADHLSEAIASIQAQTYEDFEFLIVDDASTDETSNILASYARQDTRLNCFYNPINKGLTKNLNFLLKQARGQFIARMDGDDISEPVRFSEEVQLLLSRNVDLVWTNAVLIDDEGRVICQRYQPPLEKTLARLSDNVRWGNYIVHPSVMFKRDTVMALGGYDETFRSGQDGDLWMRMRREGCRFALIDKPLLKYRIGSNSITTKRLGHSDMNFLYAYMCLANRQPDKGWQYLKAVKSPLKRLYLLIRYWIGEDTIHFLKKFKVDNYDRTHKRRV